MNLFDSKKKLGIAGVVMGLVAATLAYFGNPANMAICIACFVRDTAGALGLHSAEPVQYASPEIIGIACGYGEALELVRQLAEATYRKQKNGDIRHYLSGQQEDEACT